MNFLFLESWDRFLPRQGGHVLGLMGSGGKTSLMLAISEFYRSAGIPTTLTTTTLCEILPGVPDRVWSPTQPPPADLPDGAFVHAGGDGAGKWRGLAPADVDALSLQDRRRVVLCEVDGAAKLPLKLYRPQEPCWPRRTSLALIVMGAGAVGLPAGRTIHRLGRPGATPAGLRDLDPQAAVTWQDMDALLGDRGGYLQQVPDRVPAVLVLAGMASVADSIGLFAFAGRSMGHERLPLLVFCELCGPQPHLRTACRAQESGAEGP